MPLDRLDSLLRRIFALGFWALIGLVLATAVLITTAQTPLRVVDGDTIHINGERVRLAALDCPELHQPGGREAKAHLMALVRDKSVSCEFSGRDRYQRMVGHCFARAWASQGVLTLQHSLTCQMIRSGLCQRYARYDRDRRYEDCR